MIISSIIDNNFPVVTPTTTAERALEMMREHVVRQLPVVNNEAYLGLLLEDDLLDVAHSSEIALDTLLKVAVPESQHIFFALKQSSLHQLSILPVVSSDDEYLGVVTETALIQATASFLAVNDPGAVIILEMEKQQYAFGEISRLVETNDAYITQLNTHTNPTTGLLELTLKINKFEVSDIIATFQRYDYNIKSYFGEEIYRNQLKDNYDLLMTYLKM